MTGACDHHEHDHDLAHTHDLHTDGHHHGHGHSHVVEVTADSQRRVFWVMLLTGSFMVAQVIGGILSGSLALLADSGHMLSDTAALGLAWLAFQFGRRPGDPKRSYGYGRFEILAAFINGLTLFAIAAWIVVEASERLQRPVEVLGGPMLIVAVIGLVVNIVGFVILHRGDRENVNMRGALLHVMGDMLGSVAAIGAALAILLTGWMPIDPILSVLVALLILRSAWDLVRRSGHILMEGTPEAIDPAEVVRDLHENVPQVEDVHHVHVWGLTGERLIGTLHIRAQAGADAGSVLRAVKERLDKRFRITHSTVQLEDETCPDREGGQGLEAA